jgi:hypothetical protein
MQLHGGIVKSLQFDISCPFSSAALDRPINQFHDERNHQGICAVCTSPTVSGLNVIGRGTGGADVVCDVSTGRRISLRPGLGWQRVSCSVYGL